MHLHGDRGKLGYDIQTDRFEQIFSCAWLRAKWDMFNASSRRHADGLSWEKAYLYAYCWDGRSSRRHID